MAYLTIHPDYAEAVARAGLASPQDFLRLDAVIIGGHPGRNVARVTVKCPTRTIRAIVKREHIISWKNRIFNACAGFGLSSMSRREALLLDRLAGLGICSPGWVAHGEDGRGRAFLLIPEVAGAIDLRAYLQLAAAKSGPPRLLLARRLGQEIARIHLAGIHHPDLVSKHVLVTPDQRVCIIDWQRGRFLGKIGWQLRLAGMALLDATVGANLASDQERLLCFAAYLRAIRKHEGEAPALRATASEVRRQALVLNRNRRIREMQYPPTCRAEQSVVWCDGEALCMRPQFRASLPDREPSWLRLENLPDAGTSLYLEERVAIPGQGTGMLVRRRQRSWFFWLRSLLRAERPTSVEVHHAGLLFRLERLGIPVPPLLAFGQRRRGAGALESFLLIGQSRESRSPGEWLKATRYLERGAARRRLVAEAGRLLRAMHDKGFFLRAGKSRNSDNVFAVTWGPDGSEHVILDRVGLVEPCWRQAKARAHADLCKLAGSRAVSILSRPDRLRFYLAYYGCRRLRRLDREMVRRLSQSRSSWNDWKTVVGLAR